MIDKIFNYKRAILIKNLKLRITKNVLMAKDFLCYNKLFSFKIKKTKMFQSYQRYNFEKKLTYKKIKRSLVIKKKKVSNIRKIFKNKSFKNFVSNIFKFQNLYHKFKKNNLNIF